MVMGYKVNLETFIKKAAFFSLFAKKNFFFFFFLKLFHLFHLFHIKKKMEKKFWPDIIYDLKLLLETGGNQDVLIQAGKNSDYKELYAHSLILGCRSQYFRDAFSINSIEKIDGKYIIKRPDISPRSFSNILWYVII